MPTANHKLSKDFKKIIEEAIKQDVMVKTKHNKAIFSKGTENITFHYGDKGIYDLYRRLKKIGVELHTLTKICRK
jgi:hypothetical protein